MMHISKFQLKLTIIFLLLLFVPALIATLLNRYILTLKSTGMDVDTRIEAVLQEANNIAYQMIEEAMEECRFVAEELADDKEVLASLSSAEKLADLVNDILSGDHLNAVILDFRNGKPEGDVRFSTSSSDMDVLRTIAGDLKSKRTPYSHQEKTTVYGIAPILDKDRLVGAAIVYQELRQELVTNIIELNYLLRAYALRQDLENLIWLGVIGLIVIFAIAGALLAALLARSVTKPILSLVAGTREVAKGNLDYQVEVKGRDEVATLVESFNSMTSQLKASRERLLRAERLAAWRDIARRIAHEIKNPLTPIQLSMYRLRKNLGSEKYDDIFQQAYSSITKEVENLRNMVTEFSQFARMPKPRTRSSYPNEIVQDAINLYTGLPENIAIKTDFADNLPQIMADRDQMRQVFHNLIGNAVDAMSEGGEIYVKTRLDADDMITIEVSDNGCGMSEEVRQRIFTPYFTTKEKGTGLGMAISAQIVEEHGGEISVNSEEGVGTQVIIKLKADHR